MATNLDLDDKLVEEAKRLGKHRSKRAAVNEALAESVASRRWRKIPHLSRSPGWDTT